MSKPKKNKTELNRNVPISKVIKQNKTDFSKFNLCLEWIVLGIILLFTISIRVNFLEIPFERDEGAYTYCGKAILNGAIPFKDLGSNRLPGIFYFYSVLVFIFGYSVKAMHSAFLFINLATIVTLFLIGKKLLNSITGLTIAAAFALLSLTPQASGFTIQSEHIVACSGFAGFLFLLHYFDKHKLYFLILSSCCLTIAFQTKQTSMFYVIFSAVLFLFHHLVKKPIEWKKTIVNAVVYASCFLIPILFTLFIVWYRGAAEDFKIWMVDIQKLYVSVISFSQGLTYLEGNMKAFTQDYYYLWVLAFIGPILIWFTKTSLFNKIFVSGIFVFCFFTVVPGYHYYGHYFLQWIPAVAASVGATIYSIQSILERITKSTLVSSSIVVIIFFVAASNNISKMKDYYFKSNHTRILRAVYGLNPFPESMVVAKHLNSIMKPEDEIAVFGNEIQMYVYTNRVSPSRFAGSGALVEFPHPKQKEWVDEFISDVEKAAPKYLVYYDHQISWLANPRSDLSIFSWFNKFSNDYYKIIGYADMFDDQTLYVWGTEEVLKKPTRSKFRILLYEKKA